MSVTWQMPGVPGFHVFKLKRKKKKIIHKWSRTESASTKCLSYISKLHVFCFLFFFKLRTKQPVSVRMVYNVPKPLVLKNHSHTAQVIWEAVWILVTSWGWADIVWLIEIVTTKVHSIVLCLLENMILKLSVIFLFAC